MSKQILRSTPILVLLIQGAICCSQHRSYFGLGMELGFKSVHNMGGVIGEYNYKNLFVIHLGDANNKWMGVGYGAGLNVHLFRKCRWQLVVGGGASRQMGKGFSMGGEDSLSRSEYVTPSGKFITAVIGAHHFIISPDECMGGKVSFSPYVSYRFALDKSEVILKSGIVNESAQNRINKQLGNGFGFGIKLTYLIARSPCKVRKENN